MKIADLLNVAPVLQQLMNQKMPAKAAYALAKNIKMVSTELETFETTRIKLLSDHWTLDEKTNQYQIPDEEKSKWQAMYDELITGEVQMDPYMIDQPMLEKLELTPGEMMLISWMIKDSDGGYHGSEKD